MPASLRKPGRSLEIAIVIEGPTIVNSAQRAEFAKARTRQVLRLGALRLLRTVPKGMVNLERRGFHLARSLEHY